MWVFTSLSPAAASLDAQSFAYTGWLQYATGRYELPRGTSSLYFANGLRATAGRLRASLDVPIVIQDGGAIQYGGSGIVPTGGMPDHDGSGSGMSNGMGSGMMGGSSVGGGHVGLADPFGRADVRLLDARSGTLGLYAATKAPFASASSGYGTGQWDYGAGLSSTMSGARFSVFLDAGYWRLGDAPGFDFRNPITYTVSAGRQIGDGAWIALGSFAGSTASIEGLPGPATFGVGATHRSATGRGFSIFTSVGLTSSAPDFTLATGWQVPILR